MTTGEVHKAKILLLQKIPAAYQRIVGWSRLTI
jgi:hypothetical protein